MGETMCKHGDLNSNPKNSCKYQADLLEATQVCRGLPELDSWINQESELFDQGRDCSSIYNVKAG